MAIPKRGSKPIVVDGVRYYWYVRRRPSYGQGLAETGLTLAVEQGGCHGSVLVVSLPQSHPGNWMGRPAVPVVPRQVAQWVRRAMAAGWASGGAGKPFLLTGQLPPEATSQLRDP